MNESRQANDICQIMLKKSEENPDGRMLPTGS